MLKQMKHPSSKSNNDRQRADGGSNLRARLLRMIIENEQARKPKSQ
ncbi:MAG: hypothetical protein ACODAD_16025 [Planctomycetota bacterium]